MGFFFPFPFPRPAVRHRALRPARATHVFAKTRTSTWAFSSSPSPKSHFNPQQTQSSAPPLHLRVAASSCAPREDRPSKPSSREPPSRYHYSLTGRGTRDWGTKVGKPWEAAGQGCKSIPRGTGCKHRSSLRVPAHTRAPHRAGASPPHPSGARGGSAVRTRVRTPPAPSMPRRERLPARKSSKARCRPGRATSGRSRGCVGLTGGRGSVAAGAYLPPHGTEGSHCLGAIYSSGVLKSLFLSARLFM